MITRRSRSREVALQLLFQWDQNPTPLSRKAILQFATDRLLSEREAILFALQLFDGVVKHQAEIDPAISAIAENWRLSRMLPVDRNLLRLGTFELRYAKPTTPVAVVINEMIELSRRFGSADSPTFVNGILDKVASKTAAALAAAAAPPAPAPATPAAPPAPAPTPAPAAASAPSSSDSK